MSPNPFDAGLADDGRRRQPPPMTNGACPLDDDMDAAHLASLLGTTSTADPSRGGAVPAPALAAIEPPPPRIGDALAASIERAERRSTGHEKPIPLPFRSLEAHFGGGLWPGLHVLNAGTGVGKTQYGLQVGTTAAKVGIPVLYIGLELGEIDLAFRMLGEEARVPWSALWTGQAGPAYLARVREAVPALQGLPFHYEVSRPHGYAPSALSAAVERLRKEYPESDGPGSRPMLVVVDFLQLVGDEPGDDQDMRQRIGRASYVLRDVANRLNVAVLCISSIARERYKLMSEIGAGAELAFDVDDEGRPTKRRILNTDAIVGAGKESGDIEYSADSVSVIARVPATWDGTGSDAVFVTAKGRATGATWSPLHFTGFRYEECPDGGAGVVSAWKDASRARERARDEKRTAKETAKEADAQARIAADVAAVRAYVVTHPGCGVREARIATVADQGKRWAPAVAALGRVLVQTKTGSKVSLSLADEVTP